MPDGQLLVSAADTNDVASYGGDYDFGQRYRDVMGLQIGDGTANIMKMIIGRQKITQYRL